MTMYNPEQPHAPPAVEALTDAELLATRDRCQRELGRRGMGEPLAARRPEVAIRYLLEHARQPIHALDAVACLIQNHGFADDAAVDLLNSLVQNGTISMSLDGVLTWESVSNEYF